MEPLGPRKFPQMSNLGCLPADLAELLTGLVLSPCRAVAIKRNQQGKLNLQLNRAGGW
jgi:hypothetical protein